MKQYLALFLGLLLFVAGAVSVAEDRDTIVRNDREEVQATGHWIYNDLQQGIAEAERTGKPLLVVFR